MSDYDILVKGRYGCAVVLAVLLVTFGLGIFVGATLATSRPAPTPSPQPSAATMTGAPSSGTWPSLPVLLPSGDAGDGQGMERRPSAAPHPTGGIGAAASYCKPGYCATPKPKPLTVKGGIAGVASWYAYVPGGAAAGPELRKYLGADWRGTTVLVCRTDPSVCVVVVLSDFCRCNTAGIKLIDLDLASFAALRAPTFGTVDVTVKEFAP